MSKGTNRDLSIDRLPISLLKLDPCNPKRHSPRQINQIARSIEAFGFNVPVLIDENDTVIAGHGRVLASQTLGLHDVPVIRLAHLTAAQARAFAIADNRLTELSTWDDRLLGEIFRDLAELKLDFSLEATGFSMAEVDLRIEGLPTSPSGEADPADELPHTSGQPAVSEPGDLWILGKHRVLCGDALDPASYGLLLQGALAALVFTDPPYNVPIDGHVSRHGSARHREFPMASGEMTPGQFIHFLATFMGLLARHSVDGSLHFVCMDWRHMFDLLTAGKQVYTELKNLCVWTKNAAGMGSLYRSQHELVFVFKHGTAAHRNNVLLGQYGRHRTNVWAYPSANSFGRQGDEGNLIALHPTVKPVAMVADAIMDCSARGDVVLDAFLGSGTTLIAAERVGRVCYALELDPRYVDVAIRRWQRHTGDSAIHGVTGKRFDDLAIPAEAGHG